MRLGLAIIGESLSSSEQERKENRQKISGLEAELERKRTVVANGGGEKYVKRVHAKGNVVSGRENVGAQSHSGCKCFPLLLPHQL